MLSFRNQLPSWLGGGKEGEGATGPGEENKGEGGENISDANNSAPAATTTTTNPQESTIPAAAAAEKTNELKVQSNEEEGENSEATESADSNQDEADADEDKSTTGNKAISKVKNFGFSLFSTFKETGKKIGNVTTLIHDLTESTGVKLKKESKLPWEGHENEEKLKEEIISLSNDRRNFVRSPPSGVDFEYTAEKFGTVAVALLEVDPNLGKMRFDLVPKLINEDTFWRNYFYRVQLLKESFDSPQTKKRNDSSDEDEGADDIEKELNEMNFEVVGEKNLDVEKEIQEILDLK